jgi:peptidoglycan/LPS O-acetylase OafA/YrhL
MAGATTLAAARPRGRHRARRDAGVPPQSGHFRPDIEGLRAVAVGLVVAAHVVGWPAGGFIGVDVFFVISGFLITSLLVRERSRTGRISFRAFYARRVRRLLPAAFATLAATTVAAHLLFLGGRVQETVTDVVWAALFGANIHFAAEGTDYFQQTAAPSVVQHFWSLAVEEQFYLVWPALVLVAFALPLAAVHRRGAALLGVLGAVTAASFAWSLYATGTSPATAYFSTFTRAWELGLGALVAVAITHLQRIPAAVRAVLAWCGLAAVAAAALLVDETTPFPGSAAALPVVGTAMLLAWGNAPGGPGVGWALASRPARFLGGISYSLYLWHWPVVVIAAVVVAPGTTAFQVGVLAVSLALATASYYCIEQPVLHTNWLLGQRRIDPARARTVFRRARTVGLATATAGVLAACVVVADHRAGLSGDADVADARAVAATRSDLSTLQRDILAATEATEWPTDLDPGLDELPDYLTEQWETCLHVGPDNVDDCLFGDPDAELSAVVLGDSFAAAWVPALRAELVPAGWSLQTLTLGQCPNITAMTTLYDQPFDLCPEHREWAVERILDDPPDLVVLSNAWGAELQDRSADKATVFREGLTQVVQRLQATGARIVVLGAPPGSASLQSCPTALNGPDDCLLGPAPTFGPQMQVEQQVAAESGIVAVDPEQWFCVDDVCPTFVGSTPVYADGLHMTAEYARRIAPEVAAAILPS